MTCFEGVDVLANPRIVFGEVGSALKGCGILTNIFSWHDVLLLIVYEQIAIPGPLSNVAEDRAGNDRRPCDPT